MNCLIDRALTKALQRKKRVEVIARYLRMRYRIETDLKSLQRRLKSLKAEEKSGLRPQY